MCKINIKAAGEEYLAHLAALNYSAKAIWTYQSIIRKLARAFPEGETEIKKADVETWRDAQSGSLSPNSLKAYMMSLNAFFTWYSAAKSTQNPFEGVEQPLAEERKYNLLSLADIEKLLTVRRKGGYTKNDARNYAIITVLITSGLRSAELRALRLRDLDYEKGTIKVLHGKGDKSRLVPFPRIAQNAVNEYLKSAGKIKSGDILFYSEYDEKGQIITAKNGKIKRHEMNSNGLAEMIERYVYDVTGKHGIHTHTLRHAAASLWDDKGVDTRTIQKAMGHSSITTTERIYISILDQSKAAAKINGAFGD